MIVNSWLGIRNTESSRSIPNNALADAVDCDISDAGVITKRNGYVLAKSLTNVTSAYSTMNQDGYVVSNGILYRIFPDLTALSLASSTATSFDDISKTLFTNDGLRIDNNVVTHIKQPSPPTALNLSVISGTMPAGMYSATYCYRSATGLESGSAPIATIELAVDGGIAIAPVAPPSGYTVIIYMTDANGVVYYDNNGIPLDDVQILAEPFPDNIEQIAYHESKLWLSKSLPNGSSIIWRSAAFHYHLYDMQKDYLIVPGKILAMASTPSALLIGTDAAIYAYSEDSLQPLTSYGVVAGRPFIKLPDGTVMMHTQRGVGIGLPFQNLSEKKASFPPGIQCSTAIIDNNGTKKFVVVNDGSGTAFNKSN